MSLADLIDRFRSERDRPYQVLDKLPDEEVAEASQREFGQEMRRKKCSLCAGTGRSGLGLSGYVMFFPGPCMTCQGTGHVYVFATAA
jgi:hypothetical protein